MRGVVKVALIVLVLTAACAKSAAAGPFEDAAAAYSRSDYATWSSPREVVHPYS